MTIFAESFGKIFKTYVFLCLFSPKLWSSSAEIVKIIVFFVLIYDFLKKRLWIMHPITMEEKIEKKALMDLKYTLHFNF